MGRRSKADCRVAVVGHGALHRGRAQTTGVWRRQSAGETGQSSPLQEPSTSHVVPFILGIGLQSVLQLVAFRILVVPDIFRRERAAHTRFFSSQVVAVTALEIPRCRSCPSAASTFAYQEGVDAEQLARQKGMIVCLGSRHCQLASIRLLDFMDYRVIVLVTEMLEWIVLSSSAESFALI